MLFSAVLIMAKLFAMHNWDIFGSLAGHGIRNTTGVKRKKNVLALYKYRTGFEAVYNTLY